MRDLDKVARQLGERDTAILRSVAEHKFLTINQIEVLHFDNAPGSRSRAARRACARLRKLGVLGGLTRSVGGTSGGSGGLVHYVDEVGDRLLRRDAERRTRRPFREPTERFLNHQLGIADAHVALVEAARNHQLELIKYEVEPGAWRDYTGIGAARLTLKPDLYAETATPGSEYVDAAFIEIDRGTESIPTLLKKCREYENYRRQGIEQERSDGAFPFVIWSMFADNEAKAERRRAALREVIAKDQSLPDDLFRVITPNQLIDTMQKGTSL
ncbi:replication-relaxation family protein [Nocardia takedensis]